MFQAKNSALSLGDIPGTSWYITSTGVCFCDSQSNLNGVHNCYTIGIFGKLLSLLLRYLYLLWNLCFKGMQLNGTGEPSTHSNKTEWKTTSGIINTDLSRWGRGFVVGLSSINQRDLSIFNHNLPWVLQTQRDSRRLYSTKADINKRDMDISRGTIDPKTLKRLKAVWNVSQTGNKVENIFNLIKDLGLWIAAYKKLSMSKGSLTKGVNSTTIDGTTLEKITKLQETVINGIYVVGGTRRVFIPKPGKPDESRPLGIPDFEDRMVQEVIRSILEFIYEPIFTPHSHGFRANRSQHTAIRYIRSKFRGAIWYIEGDITKYFDTVDHKVLVLLLEKRIDDKKFIKLIKQLLKTTIYDNKSKFISHKGVPQGSILSPLLSNIVLHELDVYMCELINLFANGKTRAPNHTYKNHLRKYGLKSARKLDLTPENMFDPNFRRMAYVRYADDFLIGIIGSHQEAKEVKAKVTSFLKDNLNLNLHQEKTKITHISKKVPFLGFLIDKTKPTLYFYHRNYTKADVTRNKLVKVYRGGTLTIKPDYNKIIKRLMVAGYCDANGIPKPNFTHFPEPQCLAITKINWIINGINAYYSISDGRKLITHRVQYILRFSLAAVFAAKYKLKTRAAVFSKAHKNLRILINPNELNKYKIDDKRKERLLKGIGVKYVDYNTIPKPDYSPLNKRFDESLTFEEFLELKTKFILKDPLESLKWRSIRGSANIFGACYICGSYEGVEIHHVKPIRFIDSSKSYVEKQLQASARTQYVLCHEHHVLAHKLSIEQIKANYDLTRSSKSSE